MEFNPFPLLVALLSGFIAGFIIVDGLPFLHKRTGQNQLPYNNAPKLNADSARRKRLSIHPIDQTIAAVKIQSIFRGFCVRKSRTLEKLRIIDQVKFDAEKIGRRFTDTRQFQLIRENEQYRLELDHQITSLLLTLDAIQGVNSFVRESRKAVNRQVFKLQETVDAIIAGKSMEGAGQTDRL